MHQVCSLTVVVCDWGACIIAGPRSCLYLYSGGHRDPRWSGYCGSGLRGLSHGTSLRSPHPESVLYTTYETPSQWDHWLVHNSRNHLNLSVIIDPMYCSQNTIFEFNFTSRSWNPKFDFNLISISSTAEVERGEQQSQACTWEWNVSAGAFANSKQKTVIICLWILIFEIFEKLKVQYVSTN